MHGKTLTLAACSILVSGLAIFSAQAQAQQSHDGQAAQGEAGGTLPSGPPLAPGWDAGMDYVFHGWSVHGNLRFASSYVSSGGYHMSGDRPVVQGIVDFVHTSGVWAEIWTSSLDPKAIDPGSNGMEVDLMYGYQHKIDDNWTAYFTGGWYMFPGSQPAGVSDSTDYELGVKYSFSPGTALSWSITRDPGSLSSSHTWSTSSELSYNFGNGYSARAGISYTRPDDSSSKTKTRWFVRGKKSFADGKYDIDLRYVDTNRDNRKMYGGQWVVTVGFNF